MCSQKCVNTTFRPTPFSAAQLIMGSVLIYEKLEICQKNHVKTLFLYYTSIFQTLG